jgi:head-tail adaptor
MKKARGQRHHLVTVQGAGAPVATPDGYTTPYTDLSPALMYASIDGPPREDEAIAGNVERAKISHTVEMDYHPEVTRNSRIVFGTRNLYVRGLVNEEERNQTLTLLCEEIEGSV